MSKVYTYSQGHWAIEMAMTSPGHQQSKKLWVQVSGIGEIPVAMGLWLASALFVPGVNLPRLTKLLAEGVLFSVIKTRLIQALVLHPGWKAMFSPRSLQILGGVCSHNQFWFEVFPLCGSWTSPCLSSSAGLFSLLLCWPKWSWFLQVLSWDALCVADFRKSWGRQGVFTDRMPNHLTVITRHTCT